MLELARVKAPAIEFVQGSALDLPYADGEFAAATVGFGARNFSDLGRGLSEMARVVRPGGRVVVLEITTPQKPPLSLFFRLWFDRVVPLLGRLAGDPEAYTYLPSSVRRFPGPARPRRRAGRRWARGRRLGAHRRRHHRPAPRHGARGETVSTTPATLASVLDAGGPALARALERIEARLSEVTEAHGTELAGHAAGTLAAGGKRLRPVVVVLSGGEGDALTSAAAAVELLHMATLVHDDVLDAARLRRGVPTVFAVGGRGAATATGDLLFSRAFAELASTRSPEAVRALSGASSALARGELMQRADAWSATVSARALPRALRAQDREPVRRGRAAGRHAGRRPRRRGGPGRLRPRASGSPSRSWTTCSTCPGPPSGPASTAAPTCWTAP